ncbi:MAG: hypothetical protein Tsb0034_24490 [Ekhidna sp.]
MINYYHVLGLTENATPDEIKSAFKKLAVKYHPDKHPGRSDMEEKFKEINQAHQILSDPYEKARFDLKLKYQQFSQHQERPFASPNRSYRPDPRYYRKYYRPKVDYRKNAIATAYAFGITFLIATLVMTGVWVKKSYDSIQLKKELEARRATFQQAKDSFEAGQFKQAFEIMASLNFFRREERDMKDFKDNMINKIIENGDKEFSKKNYPAAISLYEIVQEFEPENPFYEVKKKLARSYRLTNQPEQAVAILEEFLLNEFEAIATLVKLAEINRDDLEQPNEALDFYLTAHRLAVKRYKTFYGEGYPLVIKEEYVPRSHYYLYSGLADMYLRMEDPEMAIKAADWNKYVWPDSIDAYVTSGYAYLKMNKERKACQEFAGARQRGWTKESPISCY